MCAKPNAGPNPSGLCLCGCGRKTSLAADSNRRRGYVKGEPVEYIKGHHMRVSGHSAEAREKIADALRGRVFTPEHRLSISEGKKGRPTNFTPEQLARRAERLRQMTGDQHPNWKGDDVGYKSLHDWVARHKTRTGICSVCGTDKRRTDWANISGEYRRDLDDFREMCRPCHIRYDVSEGRPRGFGTASA